MNKVILMGRLTRDPEIRHSQGDSQTAVARYTLAVDRRFKTQGSDQSADFISCVSFGKVAEFVEKYLKQGTKITGCGRIQTGSYTNRDGKKVYTIDVVMEELEFAESKNSGSNSSGGTSNNSSKGSSPAPNTDIGDGFMQIPEGLDEDLPFN